jgi:hypothetical protein
LVAAPTVTVRFVPLADAAVAGDEEMAGVADAVMAKIVCIRPTTIKQER